jgi:phosphopantetheine--protein transferase-like protein
MIGIDIINIDKIERIIDKWGEKFLNRVFSHEEIEYCKKKKNKYQCYAVRFAVKESFYKAYNHSYGWKAIEMSPSRKPSINILDKRLEKEINNFKIRLSTSHLKNIGIAIVSLSKS